jgi:hypothetical protein
MIEAQSARIANSYRMESWNADRPVPGPTGELRRRFVRLTHMLQPRIMPARTKMIPARISSTLLQPQPG